LNLVQQLEALKKERSDSMPFNNLIEFEQWADKVLPLLNFSQSHYNKFDNAVTRSTVTYRMNNNIDAATNMNEAIGILNQAITIAKTDKEKTQIISVSNLEAPAKVTINWLLTHVDFKHWVLLASIFTAIFSAGVWVGQSELYRLIINQSSTIQNAPDANK